MSEQIGIVEQTSRRSKDKEEVARQIGRITRKLVTRAKKLEGVNKDGFETVATDAVGPIGKHVQYNTVENGGAEIKTRQVPFGGSHIEVTKTDSGSGDIVKHSASEKSDYDYFGELRPMVVGTYTTSYSKNARPVKSGDHHSVHYANHGRMSPYYGAMGIGDNPRLRVYEDLDYTEEEHTDRAVSNAAKTLGTIRDTIADAEIAQSKSHTEK
jgi:hypothetical protein